MSCYKCVTGFRFLIVTGCTLYVIGILCVIISITVPNMITSKVHDEITNTLVLKPEDQMKNNEKYAHFITNDYKHAVPVYYKAFFFNVTNMDDFLNGAKLQVNQVGPYVYREIVTKDNVEFGTDFSGRKVVNYRTRTNYQFDRSQTPAHLNENDQINSLNVVFQIWRSVLAKSSLIEDYFFKVWNETNIIGDTMNDRNRMFVTKTVNELLWGYVDPRFNLVQTLSENNFNDELLNNINISNLYLNNEESRFPGFAGGNYTKDEEYFKQGLTSVYTGENDMSLIHQYYKYQGKEYNLNTDLITKKESLTWNTPFASRIWGTKGESFHMNVKKEDSLNVYLSENKRTLPLQFNYEKKVKDIKLYCFKIAPHALIANEVNQQWDMYMGGMLNMTKFNIAPMVLSKPHFLDCEYNFEEGHYNIHPDTNQHDTDICVEPLSGMVMKANKRLQMSVNTIGSLKVKQQIWFKDMIKNVFVPPVWFEESAEITNKLAQEFRVVPSMLKLSDTILVLSSVFGILFIVGGTLMMLFSMYKRYNNNNILVDQSSLLINDGYQRL